MEGIFNSHRDPDKRTNMILLDSDNRVIASADKLWIPLGAQVPVNRQALPELMMFSGREYLVRTFSAEGYQGYMGPPGWQGQVMIPVEVAFNGAAGNLLSSLSVEVAEGLLSHAQTFCPPLYDIMTAAETIRRVVWNGQVMTSGQHADTQKLKNVLDQISETGARSDELFTKSIGDLYETVLASSQRDGEFVSNLLVDLLDRNLYERSDDCRWWAVTPELRNALASPERDWETLNNLNSILDYINGLYTVYTRIFIYDENGCIIACSQPGTTPAQERNVVIGTNIDAATLAQVRALRTEQQYHVTPFMATALYDGQPTYVYHAAIRDPENDSQVIGGIGIVFDAAPEFRAMLRSGLGNKSDNTAFFVNRQGMIISSTDQNRPVGSYLDIDSSLLALPNGVSASRIVIHDDHYAMLGCTASRGYREFKTSDGYREDVLAIVLNPFGPVRPDNYISKSQTRVISHSEHPDAEEFATFFIDNALIAVPSELVQEALPASNMTTSSMGGDMECIGLIAPTRDNDKQEYVWVFDLGCLIRGTLTHITASSQVVIARYKNKTIGVLVSELHGVTQFDPEHIVPTPLALQNSSALVPRMIKANQGELLIQVVDLAYLYELISKKENESDNG